MKALLKDVQQRLKMSDEEFESYNMDVEHTEKILKEESAFFPDDHEAHMITHSKAATEKEGFSLNLEQPLDRINQDIVQHVLNSCNGNQTAAAKKLGISRTTLWRYINR